MAQPSVASYFNTRKRNAINEIKTIRARKLLHQENATLVDNNVEHSKELSNAEQAISKTKSKEKTLPIDPTDLNGKIVLAKPTSSSNDGKATAKKAVRSTKTKKIKEDEHQPNIEELFNNMTKKDVKQPKDENEILESVVLDPVELHKTPPSTPTKQNAMDKVKLSGKEMSIKEVRQKLTRSHRLAELRASMARFNELDSKLKAIEKKTSKIHESPSLKAFKSIEFEVTLSPKKFQSPEKAYLSPRKDSTAKKNLLHLLSPTKNAVSLPKTENKSLTTEKLALTLPFKYRTLAELFRSIDTVCQIMHNRKETITFKKLKPAVEELIKRNLTDRHLSQIKHLYPDAFSFKQEKIRAYGVKIETWELVIAPKIEGESMTSDILLERRRYLFKTLIEKVKVYHQEFLSSLEPPMVVDPEKITRWHPEFDIERVPEIEFAALPQPPQEDKLVTGKEVLDRAKLMFKCNTRMEAALERLHKAKENAGKSEEQVVPDPEPAKDAMSQSVLKGIPKSLLEKVRQKQAAKALEKMTRSDSKDKEVQLYSHLPEMARLTRSLFVAEKRSVLPIDVVLEKLTNCIRTHMTKSDIEIRLKTIEKEVPGWLMFHNIRNQVYIKIAKDADLSLVQLKLEKVLKQKIDA